MKKSKLQKLVEEMNQVLGLNALKIQNAMIITHAL